MTEKTEMVKVSTWVWCLIDWNSNEPLFYYNPKEDIFQRQFNGDCAYWSKKACLGKEKELNLEGVQMIEGTMEVPKEQLIDSIMDAFVGVGLVEKND